MICTSCNNVGIYNELSGKSYYYCRTCKNEINLTLVESEKSNLDYIDTFLGFITLMKYSDKDSTIFEKISELKTKNRNVTTVFLNEYAYIGFHIFMGSRATNITMQDKSGKTHLGLLNYTTCGAVSVFPHKNVPESYLAYTLD